jgi:hypothetical protein
MAELGAGTVWLRANLIDPASPADALVGVTITFGLLTSGVVSLVGDTLSALDGTIVLIVAQAPVAPETTGDASAAKYASPGELTVAFSPAILALTASGPASASVYGIDLAAAPTGGPARYVAAFDTIALPMALAGSAQFAPAAVLSPLFAPAGAAAISSMAWALPITHAPPAALAEGEGPGAALLSLAEGLSVRIAGEAAPTALESWSVVVGTDLIIALAARGAARQSQRLSLWTQGAGGSALLDSPAGSLVSFLAWAGGESVRFGGVASVSSSVPVTADGEAIDFPPGPAVAALSFGPPGLEFILFAAPPIPKVPRQFPFVIDNALVGCGWPQLIVVAAVLNDDRVIAALVDFAFPLLSFLPTLPDPYATSAETPFSTGQTMGLIHAAALALAERVEVGFTFSASSTALFGSVAEANAFVRVQGVELIDVSTNADLFGVRLAMQSFGNLTIAGLSANLPEGGLGVVTVPHISWEPLVGAPLSVLTSFDDGPQTLLYVVTKPRSNRSRAP